MLATVAAALLGIIAHSDNAAAIAHRNQYPPEAHPYLYYATTWQAATPEAQHNEAVALSLVLNQISPADVIEYGSPLAVTPTLACLDLRRLEIHPTDWARVVAPNPYDQSPMVVPASWLILQLSDANRRPEAYYPLCTGGYDAKGVLQPGIIPKTRDEWLTRLGVDVTRAQVVGQIEGQSGVAQAKVRWLESRTMLASRGYCWGTRDSRELTGAFDPRESPIGAFKHDAEEWITWRYKTSELTGAQGVLPVYAIFQGNGALQAAAPPDIVVDHTNFRGNPQIVAPGSCIQCHLQGAQFPTKDAFKGLLDSGVRRIDQYEDQARAITAFHGADKMKELRRIAEDHGAAVQAATGEESGEAAACFHSTIDLYLAPVTLEQAAHWHSVTPQQFIDALSWATDKGAVIPASVLALLHGGTCERPAFEESFLAVRNELKRWEIDKAAQIEGQKHEPGKSAAGR